MVLKYKKFTKKIAYVVILTKRSYFNPGTRYFGRGLNYKLSPGNEYEFEQLLLNIKYNKCTWTSKLWRRGTIPIHWKSEINSAVKKKKKKKQINR